jgi:hypothetical protein
MVTLSDHTLTQSSASYAHTSCLKQGGKTKHKQLQKKRRT